MSLLPPSATDKIVEIISIFVQRMLNTKKKTVMFTYIHVLTFVNYYPDMLSCFDGHVVYFVVWL